MMTMSEIKVHERLQKFLNQDGYPTYSKIFSKYQLNITHDPSVAAYTHKRGGAVIVVVNGGLDLKSISVIVRHEILHNYLEHELRLLRHVAGKLGLNYDELADMTIEELRKYIYADNTFNIAADYEISNRGYTEVDKNTIRSIVLNGEVVRGLVTEDDHPDWINLSLEEMFDKLTEKSESDPNASKLNIPIPELSGTSGDGNPAPKGEGEDGQGQNQESQDGQSSQDSRDDSGDGKEGKEGKGSGNSQGTSSGNKNQLPPKGRNSNTKNASINIGDKGDIDIQTAEELARAANAVVDDMGNELSDEDIEDLKKAVKEHKAAIKSGTESQIAKKTEEMEQMFDDKGLLDNLMDEIDAVKTKEDKIKAEREIKRFKDSGLERFKLSLYRFLKRATDDDRNLSRKRFNKAYTNMGIVKPGWAVTDAQIPSINIYFDMSGSWDAEKIAEGELAMGVVRKLQIQGKLKARIKYFSNEVFDDMYDKRYAQKGTMGTPIMEHIAATKPDNVIIMTDSDISDIRFNTVVPGAVWLLFKGGRSHNLIDHIKGKTETHLFDI